MYKKERGNMNEDKLAAHLRDRLDNLRESKKKGVKIVGYFPGNYVPEELIYAAGAIPICFAHGGDNISANAATEVIPHIACPFARTQMGERLMKTNPYYELLDLFVAPITCQHLKKVAEIWDYYGDMEIFKLGVPHQYYGDSELDYYTRRLNDLKNKLQTLTGNAITTKKLGNAIELYNRIRELFKKISLKRRESPPRISTLDFARLNHASLYADPVFMVDFLESINSETNTKSQERSTPEEPRILLIGPNLADGDYDILRLVKEAGGEIVIEDICEGIRYYWNSIDNKGDPLTSLAKGYLQDKLPCAFMRYSSRKRLNFAFELIKDFNVSGIIWYEMLCCETYDMESFFFTREMDKRNIPMLILESSYEAEGIGQMKNRIDAFIEMVKGGI
jgi:benzoyl-CoA reductase/2-hydroxyglutaryl-CoA dehydratase subunit BcrC/BadD/HgdB